MNKRKLIIIFLVFLCFMIIVSILVNRDKKHQQMCDGITNKVLNLKDGEKVSMSEIFSFSWDKAYCYGGYVTKEQLDEFFKDAPCKPSYTDNFSETFNKMVFYKDDKIVFEYYVGVEWFIWSRHGKLQAVLLNDDILEVDIWSSNGVNVVYLYFE